MRKPREKEDGAVFHIACRCNNREHFFKGDEQKKIIMNNLTLMKKRFSLVIQTYCIMNNHLHMTLQLGKCVDISTVMQWVNTVIAVQINNSLGRNGHMWGGRFWSKIIRTLKAFFRTFRYINLNPVEAGLVKTAEDWEFGGLWHYKKYQGTKLLADNYDWVLSLFTKKWACT